MAVLNYSKTIALSVAILLSLPHLQAQICRVGIRNNTIEPKPALCEGTVAFFQGSTPAGGNGLYFYQWEMSDGNCGENSFVPIVGATGKDFMVPANLDPDACFRRVVVSGTCLDKSNRAKIPPSIIGAPEPPETTVVQPSCTTPTGTITVTSPAPAAGISYSIGGTDYSNTSGVFTGLEPGVYHVTVKHSNGCTSPEKTITIQASPDVPTGSVSPATATLCGSGAGVELSVSGGTAYQWYRNGEKIAGATAAKYTAQQAGSYTADIVSGSCQAKASGEARVVVSSPISFDLAVTDPDCTHSFGSITVKDVSGGIGKNFSYSKDNGTTFQPADTFKELAVGNYNVVVKDSAGCKSKSETATVRTFTSTLKATAAVTNIGCNQSSGAAVITAAGGKEPYQFSIDGAAFQSSNSFAGVALGAHKVVVKDAAGCVFGVSFTVIQISSTLSAVATATNISCSSKGSVSVKATGGVPAYTYSLDGGAFQSSATFDNLSAGQHKVTVKDNLGCLFEVAFEIKQSGSSPHLVVTNPPEICSGSTVNLKDASLVTGSDAGLSYSYWKDEGASIPVPDPTAVTAGTYYIKAINDPGCSVIKPVVVKERKPVPGTIAIAGSPFACIGQSILLTAGNGASYQWYRNDTAISGANAKTYSATTGGVYTVDVSDGTCTVRSAATTRLQFQSCITGPQTGVFVPTAFTPNSNGANDELRPILYNIASLGYFKVYNRWGQMVFQTREMSKGWDGTINGVPQPIETYTWILECTDHDGKTIRKSGRSLLIR